MVGQVPFISTIIDRTLNIFNSTYNATNKVALERSPIILENNYAASALYKHLTN